MKHSQFLDAQYRISFTAGMNQRYHQRRATFWSLWDRGIRIAVGLLAVASLVLLFAASAYTGWDNTAIYVALASAFFAICLNVVPLGDWQRDHVDLFRRWTDLREEIDTLGIGTDGKVADESINRLQRLEAKLHRICGSEPHFRPNTLKQCESEERLSRGEKTAGLAV